MTEQYHLPFEIETWQSLAGQPAAYRQLPKKQNQFAIVWIKTVDGAQLHCMAPGQLYCLSPSNNTEGYSIFFTESILDQGGDDFDLIYRSGLLQLFSRCPAISLSKEIAAEMQVIAEKMVREFNNLFPLRTELIKRYVKIFLIYLTRQIDCDSIARMPDKNAELLQRFISLIEDNYRNKKLVKDYASELAVTPNYLNEIVKKTSGFPAGHHIRQRVVLEAKRQAAASDVTMKEIAYDLGFEDIAHFSKFFKSACGKNFTAFKKEKTLQYNRKGL